MRILLKKYSQLTFDIVFFAFCGACLSLFTLTANAEKQPINVVTEVLQPFQYHDESGRAIGYGIDVLEAILEKTNFYPDYEFLPWQRALKKANSTKNTIILAIARTAEREKHFNWIARLQRETFSFYALKSNLISKQDSFEAIKKYSLIVTKDSVLDNYVTKLGFPNIERSNDVEQTYLMLYKNRVDLIFKSHTSIRTQTNNFGYDFKALNEVYKVPGFYTDLYIAVNAESDTNLIEELSKGFSAIEINGTYQKIRDKWLSE